MNFSVWKSLSFVILTLVTLSTAANCPAQVTARQQASTAQGSLQRIPKSAGFYFSTMNHGAIHDAIFESNAWKSIKASDVSKGMKKAYRRGRTRGYEDYNEDNPFSQYLKAYGDSVDNIIFKSVWQIVGQVFENELFVYVDNDVLPVLKSIQQVQLEIIDLVGLDDDFDDDDITDEQAKQLADMLDLYLAKQECPTIILGSRLNNPEGFRGLLELGRSAAEQGMRNLPPEAEFIRQFWKVVDEKDQYFLMADVNLSRLPWNVILEEVDNDELARFLENVMSTKRATIAVGIIDNLLVAGIARDQQQLASFGANDKLIEIPELTPLADAIAGGKTLVSASYMSREFAEAYQSIEQSLEAQKKIIRPLIQLIEDMPDADKDALADRIESELGEFTRDIVPLLPKPGMIFGFTTLETDGLHGYARQHSVHPALDGSQPLTLANHANANTLLLFNQRMKNLPDQYALVSKWGSRLYGYGKEFGLDQYASSIDQVESAVRQEMMKLKADKAALEAQAAVEDAKETVEAQIDDQLEDFNRELRGDAVPAADEVDNTSPENPVESDPVEVESSEVEEEIDELESELDDQPSIETIRAFLAEFESIAARFDLVTRQQLLPSIEKQQGCLFVQMSSGPNPWHPEMPVAKNPLPIPLPVLLLEHNDSAAIIQTGETYWSCIEDLLTSIRKHFPDAEDDLDDFELPQPEKLVTDDGTSYRWNVLTQYADIDSAVRTGTLISDNQLVLNFIPSQAVKMTLPASESSLFGPATINQPSTTLLFYDHRVLMRDLKIWFGFAEEQIEKEEGEDIFDLSKYEAERDTLQFTEAELRDALQRVWAFGECFKGLSCRSHIDNNATVTEYLLKFQDTPAVE